MQGNILESLKISFNKTYMCVCGSCVTLTEVRATHGGDGPYEHVVKLQSETLQKPASAFNCDMSEDQEKV